MEFFRNKVYRGLRASEKYTKTDMVYLTKGGFWLFLKQGSSMTISFVLAVTFANFVSKVDYGLYKYIVSMAGIIGGFSLAGFKTSVIQSVANKKEGVLAATVKESLRWGSLIFFISLLVSLYYFFNTNYSLAVAFLIVGITVPISNSYSLYESYLIGKKDFRASYQVHIIRALLAGLILFLAITLSGSPLVLTVANFLIPALFAYSAYKWVLLNRKPNDELDDKSMSYGRHLSLMGFITNFTNRFDGVLIFHYLGATPLAIYAFAGAIPDHVIGLLKQGHFLALPKFSIADKETLKKAIIRKSLIIAGLMTLVFGVYWMSAEYIFRIFFPQYIESVLASKIFSINFVLAGLTMLPGTFLDSQSETKYKYIFTWFHNVLKVVLMFALIFPYGIFGVILGEIIARIVSGILLFYFVKKV